MYVNVLVEIKSKKVDKTFTYKVPEYLEKDIEVGKRVTVPFNNRTLEGFILSINDSFDNSYEVKEIVNIIDEKPVLNEELLSLGQYITNKTLCSLVSAYNTMLPAALKAHKNYNINKKYVTYIKLIDNTYIGKNDNQKEIIDILKKGDALKSDLTKISISSINTLIKNKIIEEYVEEVYRLKTNEYSEEKRVELNSIQKDIINEIISNKDKFMPYLIHGVTGSGKTEVYMNIIENVIKDGKEVIVLVPEISLTPQMINLFKNRFKNDIAILHSALSDGEKYDEWRKIEEGKVNIVIGARSAIFAPLTNIGLIVMDEEHSETYKQENMPRYDTVDIAIKRSKYHNCPLVLGSATPSIESYTRAKEGIYKLLEMPNRINNTYPEVILVNMKDEIKKGNKILSKELIDSINDRLSKDEQIILLLNRRGYSTTITCKSCGNVIKCPNCDIPLTYHKKTNKLVCHYCNHNTFKPLKCPECGSSDINDYGMGTEKLEEEVNKLFDAKVIRMDIDTTRNKGSHERIIKDFKNKKYNILIGTQMVSKGLDFDDVTLVGVINGDASLNIPDFRSGERTYSLLNQVSGRSGRSTKPGKVIIQCYNIDHYSIKYACLNNYKDFYLEEMNIRKKLKYPPYYNLCLIKVVSKNFNELSKESNKIRDYLANNTNDVIILGPSLSSIPKVYNSYYMQIILKYKNIKDIYNNIKFIIEKYNSNSNILIDVDFNPRKI